MLQSELNDNFQSVVFTWCYDLDADVRFGSLGEVCSFNVVDGDIFIGDWYLSSPFTAPTQSDLLAMDLTTCQDTYHSAYYERSEVMGFQNMIYRETTTHLSGVLLTTADEGWLVFDTTLKKIMRYAPGTGWVALW